MARGLSDQDNQRTDRAGSDVDRWMSIRDLSPARLGKQTTVAKLRAKSDAAKFASVGKGLHKLADRLEKKLIQPGDVIHWFGDKNTSGLAIVRNGVVVENMIVIRC
jgi:hypothetical protein